MGASKSEGDWHMTRQLKPQGTRKPPKDRGEGAAGASPAPSAGQPGDDNHDNQTEDLDEYCRQLFATTDANLDRIKKEHKTAIASLGKNIQGQMKQTCEQMAKLSTQVGEGGEHTERVRLQVVAAAHTADTRLVESTKKQERSKTP